MEALFDTSAIIGVADRNCRYHKSLLGVIDKPDINLIIPSPVIPEACYMLNKMFGPAAEIKFIEDLVKVNLQIEIIKFFDLQRINEILNKYQELNLGFVDSSIVAIAERLKINRLLTLDKKHFSSIVPLGFKYFDILV